MRNANATSFPYQGRVALVTGASSGIGAAIAKRLLSEGVRVVALARRQERLQQLGQSLDAAQRDNLMPLAVDLKDETAILAGFARGPDSETFTLLVIFTVILIVIPAFGLRWLFLRVGKKRSGQN